MQLKVSSKLLDITTSPLMPFSSSIKEDLHTHRHTHTHKHIEMNPCSTHTHTHTHTHTLHTLPTLMDANTCKSECVLTNRMQVHANTYTQKQMLTCACAH